MALPQQLKTARMSNTTVGNTIDNNIGALEQAIADILGITVDVDVTASAFALTNAGQITTSLVAQRAAGPVGWRMRDTVSGKEIRIAVSGTNLVIDENVGSEGTPSWTNRFSMAIATGVITGSLATSTRMGLCPQGDGNVLHFLNGNLAYTTPTAPTVSACRVRNSGSQSIPNNTSTALTFDTEDYDNDTIHSTISNTSRLTCRTAGKYYVVGAILWAANAVNQRTLQIRSNGSTIRGQTDDIPNASSTHAQQVAGIVDMIVGDYVELVAYQNSGSPVSSTPGSNYAPFFAAHKVS
jgi:hypothetical protein